MKLDDVLKLPPREFMNKVFAGFKDGKITAEQMKLLCEKYLTKRRENGTK